MEDEARRPMMRGSMATVGVVLCVILAGVSFALLRPRGRPLPTTGPTPASAPQRPLPSDAAAGPTWFSTIGSTGIDFQHVTGCTVEKPFPAANGSGIGVVDFDRDGWDDLYFPTGTPFPIDPTRAAPCSRFYRNLGAFRFVEVTGSARAPHAGYGAGIAVGDYDNDGFCDIYLSCYGPNRLFHNLGDGTFERREASAGVDDDKWGTSAAFLDADRDGSLDLYVANYAKWTLETNQFCGDRKRQVRVFCGPNTVEPEPDVFYRNAGDGTFRRETEAAGLVATPGRGQGVVAADVNDDGWIDIYVTNDLNANLLFVNRGDGTFRDVSESSGAAYDAIGTRQAGMGVDAADYNEDGRIDLWVTNYQDEHNTLYENVGNDLFQDVSQSRGITLASLPWIGWGTSLSDFDLDGWLDILVTNGHVDDNRHLLGQTAPYEQPALLWKGNGRRFELVTRGAGDYFDRPHVGRALVTSDLDRDGDLDVVMGHQDGRPAILGNNAKSHAEGEPISSPGSCSIELIGTTGNRDAVGAVVVVRSGPRSRRQLVKGGGSYLSQSSRVQVVGLPDRGIPWTLEIRWPSGATTSHGELAADRAYTIWEDGRVAVKRFERPDAGDPIRE